MLPSSAVSVVARGTQPALETQTILLSFLSLDVFSERKFTSYISNDRLIPKVLSKFSDSSPITFTLRKLEIIALKRKTAVSLEIPC